MPNHESFDLVHEPWLPCLDAGGKRIEVGLSRALAQAHTVSGLRDDSPLVTGGLLRLLLAILHSALDGPADLDEWTELWEAGRFPERAIEKYLRTWRSHFDLFSPSTPFFQVPGFETSTPCPATKLAHDRATGNNATLFDHSIEERPRPVTPAEAARQLVGNQSYALGGGMSGTSQFGRHPNFRHAPMIGGVAVFLQGATLFETLLLNLLAMKRQRHDQPVWEHEQIHKPGRHAPTGHLETLTWRSRFVRLIPDDSGTPGVTQMYYAQGWEFARDVLNPFFAYVSTDKNGVFPITLRVNRALWRDSAAFLGAAQSSQSAPRPLAVTQAIELVKRKVLDPERALQCLVVGLANDKAKPLLWREERFAVSAKLLEDAVLSRELVAGIQHAEDIGRALQSAVKAFRSHLNDALPGVQTKVEIAYWTALDSKFSAYVSTLGKGAAALPAFLGTIDNVARDAYDNVTENAVRQNAREFQARVAGKAILSHLIRKINDPSKENDDAAD